MTERSLSPPSGYPPPASATLGRDATLDLIHLAQEICRVYRAEFPDEEKRYGDAGNAWCVHDNQHLLSWAAGEVNGHFRMNPQVAWLARVLEARGFPLDRLARNLEIGTDVVRSRVRGRPGEGLVAVLADAAAFVRSRDTFLD